MTTTKMSDTKMLRADLELTRQHLADTVQELSRQLNFPRRIKESATGAAGTAAERAKQVPAIAKQVPAMAKQVPAQARQHPRATAAIGGAAALGVGATAWAVLRHK
jgi:hypothetical protein